MANNLIALQREIDELQTRKAELEAQVETLKGCTETLQQALDAVNRGILFGIGRRNLLLLFAAIAGIAGTAVWATTRRPDPGHHARRSHALQRAMEPHLLVTSEPSGAAVFRDGGQIGRTPLVLPAPRNARRRFAIEIRAKGYHPVHQMVQTGPDGGAHLHAKLEPIVPQRRRKRLGPYRTIQTIRGFPVPPAK